MADQRNFEWEDLYRTVKVTEMPWYNPDLDKDLAYALDNLGLKSGTFLDIGTGPATQAKQLQDKGFEVTGIDLSESAISLAKQAYPTIEFFQDDILTTSLSKKFDYIFDRGCFHVIEVDKRGIYVRNVFNLLKDNGLLFLKCFSDKMPDTGVGPHRFSEQIIKDIFRPTFTIEEIKESEFNNDKNPQPVKALFVMMKRR